MCVRAPKAEQAVEPLAVGAELCAGLPPFQLGLLKGCLLVREIEIGDVAGLMLAHREVNAGFVDFNNRLQSVN